MALMVSGKQLCIIHHEEFHCQLGNIIHISKQLVYFAQYQKRVSSLIGAEQTTRLVNGALLSLPDYVDYLLSESKQILTRLYDLGARRVLVQDLAPLGCTPGELALHNSLDGSCDPEIQRAVELYNPRLLSMLRELNAVFVGVETNRIISDALANAKDACCGQGRAGSTAWASAPRNPTSAPTATPTCSGTRSTPRTAPTG
ncbi:hypothetical protein EJB05_19248, partial [Eragrostis curvula]